MSSELFFTHCLLKAGGVTAGDRRSTECHIGLGLDETPHLQLQQYQLQDAVASRDIVTVVNNKSLDTVIRLCKSCLGVSMRKRYLTALFAFKINIGFKITAKS